MSKFPTDTNQIPFEWSLIWRVGGVQYNVLAIQQPKLDAGDKKSNNSSIVWNNQITVLVGLLYVWEISASVDFTPSIEPMVSDPSATVSTRAVICAIAFEPKQSSEVGLHSCARLCQVAKSSWPIVCV
jgi:hypothetical protein